LENSVLLKNYFAMCLSKAWKETKRDHYFTRALRQFEELYAADNDDWRIVVHAYRLCEQNNNAVPHANWPQDQANWRRRFEELRVQDPEPSEDTPDDGEI